MALLFKLFRGEASEIMWKPFLDNGRWKSPCFSYTGVKAFLDKEKSYDDPFTKW